MTSRFRTCKANQSQARLRDVLMPHPSFIVALLTARNYAQPLSNLAQSMYVPAGITPQVHLLLHGPWTMDRRPVRVVVGGLIMHSLHVRCATLVEWLVGIWFRTNVRQRRVYDVSNFSEFFRCYLYAPGCGVAASISQAIGWIICRGGPEALGTNQYEICLWQSWL